MSPERRPEVPPFPSSDSGPRAFRPKEDGMASSENERMRLIEEAVQRALDFLQFDNLAGGTITKPDGEFEIDYASGTAKFAGLGITSAGTPDRVVLTSSAGDHIYMEPATGIWAVASGANAYFNVDISSAWTESLRYKNAGSAAATEQDWIEVEVGGNTGYIRVFAAK